MIKLVAFDWNGTLFADTEPLKKAVNAILRHFKVPQISTKRFKETFDQPMTKLYAHFGFTENMIIKNQKLINKIFTENYEELADKCRSRSGTKESLEYLYKNRILSIIYSNHTVPDIERQLKRLKINQFINTVLARQVGDISHYHKRSKDQKLQDYIKAGKFKPNEVISVGDTEEEIQIGKSLGCHTVAITGGYNTTSRLKKHHPDFLIHNIKDLIPVVKKLNQK